MGRRAMVGWLARRPYPSRVSGLEQLLSRMEDLLGQAERLDEEPRTVAFELLDGIDTIHRFALHRLVEQLGQAAVSELRDADPAVAWLFDAYGLGVDEVAAAEAALTGVRPYLHSHGGEVEVLGARAGVVSLRLSGTCSGCTASAETLRTSIDEALREHLPGFLRTEVEEDTAEAHPPPVGAVPVQIRPRPH